MVSIYTTNGQGCSKLHALNSCSLLWPQELSLRSYSPLKSVLMSFFHKNIVYCSQNHKELGKYMFSMLLIFHLRGCLEIVIIGLKILATLSSPFA